MQWLCWPLLPCRFRGRWDLVHLSLKLLSLFDSHQGVWTWIRRLDSLPQEDTMSNLWPNIVITRHGNSSSLDWKQKRDIFSVTSLLSPSPEHHFWNRQFGWQLWFINFTGWSGWKVAITNLNGALRGVLRVLLTSSSLYQCDNCVGLYCLAGLHL